VKPTAGLRIASVLFSVKGSAKSLKTAAPFRGKLPLTRTIARNTVTAVVTDTAGRTGATAARLDVTPRPLPGAPGVSINDGAHYTNKPNVTVTAIWPLFATQMLVSNDGGFTGAAPTNVNPHFSWRLGRRSGPLVSKTIYVRFIGGLAGNETYQDDIILDQTAPRVVSATAVAEGTRTATAARKRGLKHVFRVRVKAKDTVSGVAAIQVTQNRRLPHSWQKYRSRLRFRGKGSRRIYVRVRDRAANRSPWQRVTRAPER